MTSGIPFTPEVVVGDARYPLCGYGFDNARDMCKGFQFQYGGEMILTNEVFDTDAHNDMGEASSDERCKAGNPAGFQIVCHAQVRTKQSTSHIKSTFLPHMYIEADTQSSPHVDVTVIFWSRLCTVLCQCRTFKDYREDFDAELTLEACHPYLSEDRVYYLVCSPPSLPFATPLPSPHCTHRNFF